MPLIKTVVKPERNIRLTFAIKETQLREIHAYRVFLETEHGYRPPLGETVALFIAHVLEDKDFAKWYDPKNREQSARVNAAIKADASKKKEDDDAAE